jgi:phytoene desaturase
MLSDTAAINGTMPSPRAASPSGATPPHAIVIGSGFGGLAAAIRLRVRGYRVTVLEKLDAPGGRAYVHHQDGFTFDAGPTIITAPFLFEELWALCGRRMADDIDLRLMQPFYRVRFDDGSWFDYRGDAASMREEVARFNPADVAGYDSFMREAEFCYKLGFEDMADKAFDTLGDLISAVPSMVRMRAWRSLHAMVASHFSDPKLRIVMSFHPLLIGGDPFAVTSAYSLIAPLERRYGVHSAMGGTGALVRGLVSLLEGAGGELRCNSEVQRIDIDRGRATGVTLRNGQRLAADLVVSNADSAWTYRHLVEPEHRRHWTDRKIDSGRYSMGLYVWYFGTRKRYEDVPHHMMVLGPRYKELLQDIFRHKKLTDDFSLYLHRRPPPTPRWPHQAATPSTPGAGAPSGQRHRLAGPRRDLPAGRPAPPRSHRAAGLGTEIVSSKVTTPLDFQDRLLSFKGAGFGLEPLLLQSAWFRPHNRSEDVQGLYLVGASTHPGAGLPGVLSSAKALMSVLPSTTNLATAPA